MLRLLLPIPRKRKPSKSFFRGGSVCLQRSRGRFSECPRIDEIDVSHYTGQPSSYIQVRAVDDFTVAEVTVTIQIADGTEVESGAALLQPGTTWWRYTATTVNESLEGDKIIVWVSDTPGNLSEGEQPATAQR